MRRGWSMGFWSPSCVQVCLALVSQRGRGGVIVHDLGGALRGYTGSFESTPGPHREAGRHSGATPGARKEYPPGPPPGTHPTPGPHRQGRTHSGDTPGARNPCPLPHPCARFPPEGETYYMEQIGHRNRTHVRNKEILI